MNYHNLGDDGLRDRFVISLAYLAANPVEEVEVCPVAFLEAYLVIMLVASLVVAYSGASLTCEAYAARHGTMVKSY
jgi:hypothetical protein